MAQDKSDSLSHFFGGTATGDDTDFSLDTPAPTQTPEEPAATTDGEIAIDCYQTDTHVVIVSPLAGVKPDELEIAASDDSLTISGQRSGEHVSQSENMITQEIYWGSFSRTVELPAPCEVDKAQASFKHGVLTVKIPKSGKAKKRLIKVKTEE